MAEKVRATVRNGKIELLEHVDLPEGAKILVLLLPDDESQFWMEASLISLNAVWDNPQDDVYAQLLEK
ncbi:MAG: antitoxin family protein [Acidobacteriia bacterium]|nr:antitoxin family protein [Terriglobia bacterium]